MTGPPPQPERSDPGPPPDPGRASGPGRASEAGRASEPGQAVGERARRSWLDRRRNKVIHEIQRNRRGEYTVPTWVLGAILAFIVVAWLGLIILV